MSRDVADCVKNIMSPQPTTTTTPTSATQSDISSLSKSVQSLSSRVNLANNLYIGFLALTLIASILIVRYNGKLNDAKGALERAKDGKVANDLKDKDVHISDALKSAGEANESAAKLEKEASRLGIELTKAKQSLMDAEIELAAVKKRQERRQLNWEKFTKALEGKSKCEIEILCQPHDEQAYALAKHISIMLATAGWPLVEPNPIPDDIGTQPPVILNSDGSQHTLAPWEKEIWTRLFREQPPTVRAGASATAVLSSFSPSSGIFIVPNKEMPTPLDPETPYAVLVNAFTAAGLIPNGGLDVHLPDNKLRIIVGPKP
jgi:hypothetical protein